MTVIYRLVMNYECDGNQKRIKDKGQRNNRKLTVLKQKHKRGRFSQISSQTIVIVIQLWIPGHDCEGCTNIQSEDCDLSIMKYQDTDVKVCTNIQSDDVIVS